MNHINNILVCVVEEYTSKAVVCAPLQSSLNNRI